MWNQEVVFKITSLELEGENRHLRGVFMKPEAWDKELLSKMQPVPETKEEEGKTKKRTAKKQSLPPPTEDANATMPLSQFQQSLKIHSTPIPGVTGLASKNLKRKKAEPAECDESPSGLFLPPQSSEEQPELSPKKKKKKEKLEKEQKLEQGGDKSKQESGEKADAVVEVQKLLEMARKKADTIINSEKDGISAGEGDSTKNKIVEVKKAGKEKVKATPKKSVEVNGVAKKVETKEDSESSSEDETTLPAMLRKTLEKVVKQEPVVAATAVAKKGSKAAPKTKAASNGSEADPTMALLMAMRSELFQSDDLPEAEDTSAKKEKKKAPASKVKEAKKADEKKPPSEVKSKAKVENDVKPKKSEAKKKKEEKKPKEKKEKSKPDAKLQNSAAVKAKAAKKGKAKKDEAGAKYPKFEDDMDLNAFAMQLLQKQIKDLNSK
ncbi:eukaryotic translation initiation factor 5B-like [Cloeon dipterum]|uniref:eukaryotic translation initiation factor 5B-like n=1 Tax=Cloeon dipterum TaxID=197152 RepID=UPI00321FC5C7